MSSEDVAAAEIAAAVAGEGVHVDRAFTGRANLFAEHAGVLVVDKAGVDALNDVDPAITFATLAAYAPVVAGKMIATVKIIPFAVDGRGARQGGRRCARRASRSSASRRSRSRRSASSRPLLPGLADKVIEKTLKVTAERLAPAGATIVAEKRVPHETKALAKALDEVLKAGAELVVVFGASAIADTRDVIPAAVERSAGGSSISACRSIPAICCWSREASGRPVLGAPGCARSPKENGFDWILMRLLAGLPVKRADITGLGVGGLLMEIVTRPQPRAEPGAGEGRIASPALVLAAGRSTRMGGPNKLLEEINGKPLVRIVAEQALASRARPGHRRHRPSARARRARARRARGARSCTIRISPRAFPPRSRPASPRCRADADGAIVCLGDMPQVSAKLIDRLIAAFDPERGALVVIPTIDGKRGNPVLWSRRFFPDLLPSKAMSARGI